MATSTVSTKGQIVIPAAVRHDFGLEAGSRVEFLKFPGRVSPEAGDGLDLGPRGHSRQAAEADLGGDDAPGRPAPGQGMIGLDTNVLGRYLAQDDARQSAIASRLIEKALTEDVPGFVSAIVLVGTVWVMEDLYEAERGRVAEVVEALLRARTMIVEDAEIVWRALETFNTGRADFADCMIQAFATFDKVAARGAGMTLLS
jgi:AbrB family looped-hinge helix DNA binding protein